MIRVLISLVAGFLLAHVVDYIGPRLAQLMARRRAPAASPGATVSELLPRAVRRRGARLYSKQLFHQVSRR